jgi:GYD domain
MSSNPARFGRADAFKDMAKKCGATVKDVFWTLGEYDVIAIVDAPDDVSMTAWTTESPRRDSALLPCRRIRTSSAPVCRATKTRNLHFAVRPVPKVRYSEAFQEWICLDYFFSLGPTRCVGVCHDEGTQSDAR